ncbi:hypothetical protein BCR34DRAFT_352052 [Clohesyomyces aquaticus]|uniref:Uncharacterized protein n=1 Tax=Clohesyomyces aquaticus TaxID=1231657 RepID=A0A1Y1ZJB0_9PLEO|nr:hypothetical protein BCR34DRAFT_352052 [Clohesyomyces aquaticus]
MDIKSSGFPSLHKAPPSMVQSSLSHSPFDFDSLGEIRHGTKMTIIHCEEPHCDWIRLGRLTGLQNVPNLLPNPDLSGIRVSLINSSTFSLNCLCDSGILDNSISDINSPRHTSHTTLLCMTSISKMRMATQLSIRSIAVFSHFCGTSFSVTLNS